ncbi:MAG: QacE family quaternary ammonium compound efflux SMR transporter [Pseudomonadales bacterium]|nr:QacE family quaternary ammonium compound efflux SMR transporter [Pseudomonadales bacterium]MCP5356558.1 QacE family quaternary ammonium compound efflux SMR transporter [Pseudomonadales bacterium]
MIWGVILLAGLLEIVWAIGLKLSEGLSKPLASVVTVLAMVLSVFLLGLAMRSLPASTAYAVWVGIGVVGTAITGHLLLAEPIRLAGAFSIGLIVLGIVGLKLSA